ncbi:FAD-dependent oxidoreductase, partial [Saccharothrix hoggarensis]
RVGIVGADLIGAEVAASAVSLGCEVTILDPAAPPLAPVVGPEIAAVLHAQHERHGVRVLANGVRAVEDQGDRVRLHHDGGVVTCDVVVVGIGIELDLSLAVDAGLATDGGVLVDDAQRTSNPHVFAAGDVARRTGQRRTEHWDAARREGRAAGRGLLGLPAPEPGAPWFWSDRYATRLECVGEFTGADETVVRGDLHGDFTAIALRGGRLAGAVAVNRAADITALRRIVGQPLDADRLRDGSADLRALARAGQRRQGATT